MTKETAPLRKMIELQEMQFELDKLRKDRMKLSTKIKSLSQKMPELLRSLELR